MKVEEVLDRHGYVWDRPTGRYSPPSATGAPGVRPIPGKDGLWRSDHGSDPLSGTFDAWVAFVVLDHGYSVTAAEAAAKRGGIAKAAAGVGMGWDAPEGTAAPEGAGGVLLPAIPASAFIAGAPTPEYLVDGIFQRGFVYAVTGPTGTGKTAVAIALGASVALGGDFAGCDTERSAVLYVASENPDDVRTRILAWCEVSGVNPEALDSNLYFVDQSFTLAHRLDDLIATVERIGAALVILDTDQALAGSEDENSNSERIEHAKRVRRIAQAASRPCVVDLCHPSMGATKASLRPRGGSAFLAEIDANAGLWRDDETETIELFRTAKFRGSAFEPLHFALREVQVEGIRDSKGRPMSSVVATPATLEHDAKAQDEFRQRTKRVLDSVGMDPDAPVRQRAFDLGLPKTTVSRILKHLVDSKRIREVAGGGYEVTVPGKKHQLHGR